MMLEVLPQKYPWIILLILLVVVAMYLVLYSDDNLPIAFSVSNTVEQQKTTTSPPLPPKYCYTTLVGSNNYIMPLMVLAYSMKLQNLSYPFIVYVTDDVLPNIPAGWEGLIDEIRVLKAEPDFLKGLSNHISELDAIQFQKLLFFKLLLEFEIVCFIDADIVIIDNIDEIFTFPTPAAHHEYWAEKGDDSVNTGFFTYEPSKTMFNFLATNLKFFYDSVREFSTICNDQYILNEAFHGRYNNTRAHNTTYWYNLPQYYVMDMRVLNLYYKKPGWMHSKVLHYPSSGRKPWSTNNPRIVLQMIQWWRFYDGLVSNYPVLTQSQKLFHANVTKLKKPEVFHNVSWHPYATIEKINERSVLGTITYDDYQDNIKPYMRLQEYNVYRNNSKK